MNAGQWGQFGFWIAFSVTVMAGIFIGKAQHHSLNKTIVFSLIAATCAFFIQSFLHWVIGFGISSIPIWLEREDLNRMSNVIYETKHFFFFLILITITIGVTRRIAPKINSSTKT